MYKMLMSFECLNLQVLTVTQNGLKD